MKILVVDRTEDIRGVLDILEKTPGNEVISSCVGQEALDMTQGQQVDLLITEVFVEPMNGFTLRNKMENRHPGVRTIFLTGYDLSPYAEYTAGYEVVTKPATPEKLFPAIARALGFGGKGPVAAPHATQLPLPLAEAAQIPPEAVPAAVPVAVPRATPAVAGTPVAVPRATPAVAGTPVAVPRATPVAGTPVAVPRVRAVDAGHAVDAARAGTPVAVPRATPAAGAPVAMPRATPAAGIPVAVSRATAVEASAPVVGPRATEVAAGAPDAVPRATPTEATRVAVPRATAAHAGTPAAVPRATAAAMGTPVAVPRATATATGTPVATPRATAVPAGTPVAMPRATAAPAGTPIATPRATAAHVSQAGTPGAAPRATAVPAGTPGAVPRASAAPAGTPVAVPRANAPQAGTPAARPRATGAHAVHAGTPVATPRATGAAGSPVVAVPKAVDPMVGKSVGNYKIERRLGTGKWGPVYLAIQTSMNRPVAMEMLSAEASNDEAARQNFVATARAKAAVQHPHILSVYEADQAEGRYFYTHEYVDGLTLEQLVGRGEGLSEPMALQTIKYVSQGLAHLHHQHVAHAIPDATDIYIGVDGLPYVSNVAQPGDEIPGVQEEIQALSALIRSVLPGGQAQDRGLQAMLMRMTIATQAGFQSWSALFQAIQAIGPKVVPVDAFKLSAQDQEAIRAVEEARKRQKRAVILSVAGLFVLLCAMGFGFWYEFMKPTMHDYSNEMVQIPAGSFIYQDGQKRTLPEFYIDKYDVTMAEYEKFLEYLVAHGNPATYDSPLQPKGMSHVPHDWDIYYGRASSSISGYRTVKGVPINLDCPVFLVNYFDAYAYAAWKGRRLPKEEEWEKAARGPAGNLYPWGNEWDPKKCNSGADYLPDPPPGYKPPVDGFTWWAPVDAFPNDRSPYGVIGMGGNVSQWTDSWDASKTYVVIRGGNYKFGAERALTTSAIRDAPPQTAGETLGFRTASDKAPGK